MRRSFLVLILLCSTALPALAEKRVALIMGANDYENIRPLKNAVNDAQAIEKALEKLGFDVIMETNRDLKRMRRALEDFKEDAEGADVALVYFAGHGVEVAGENRLLPTDADASSVDTLKTTSLPLEEVRATVTSVSKVGLIFLDACRNDPFAGGDGSGRGATALEATPIAEVKPGLGRLGKAENLLYTFSAAPGATAADGSGENSPFTAGLVKYLGTDGLEIRSVLTLVQQEVYDFSRGQQLPYVENGLPQLFFASTDKTELPERERLLLAMADVTPDLRIEVERLATEKDMPLAPLYGALISSDAKALTTDDRRRKLTEAADAFVATRAQMRAMASSDPAVTKLRQEAEQQLALGAFDTARGKLTEAATIDSASRDSLKANFVERTISEATTRSVLAGAALAELDYDAALQSYDAAARLHESIENLEVSDAARHDRTWLLADLGGLQMRAGDTARALDSFERMKKSALIRIEKTGRNVDTERDLSVSHIKIGDVRIVRGDVHGAQEAYLESLAISEKAISQFPQSATLAADLAISHTKIGDLRSIAGDLAGAQGAYLKGLAIRKELALQMPDDPQRQRDLSMSYEKVGNVLTARGDIQGATSVYLDSLTIAEKLSAQDPENLGWRRDLSISYDRIADLSAAQGDLSGAQRANFKSLAIREALVAKDPQNTELQRDLSICHDRIGDVRSALGDLAGAREAYMNSLKVRAALVARDPGNTEWQRDLSASYLRVGDMHRAQQNFPDAENAYLTALAMREKLVAQGSANAGWRRDLSITYERVGDLRAAQGDLPSAKKAYQDSLDIRDALAKFEPGNAQWLRDLSIAHTKMGDINGALRDAEGARKAYASSLAVIEKLVAQEPGNVIWQRDLAVAYNRIGDVLLRGQGDHRGAQELYLKGLVIAEKLAARDPANAGWQHDLIVSHYNLAQAGDRPRERLEKALAIAEAMARNGILAPQDASIIDTLTEQLKSLR